MDIEKFPHFLKVTKFLTPFTMPYWFYEKRDLKNTPSNRDGLDCETERRYRKEGARFIMQCGTSMGLGHNTVATGIVYFHRFYMFHSFKTFPRYATACSCLYLAGKVEETPKKCVDIIKTAQAHLSEAKFKQFGHDPKEEVTTLEQILLQTIKFDLQVEHPYNFLVKYAKCLKGDKAKLQKMVQMAWNFVNDSLSTTVCLQWEPEIIAVAMIHLASKLSKFDVVDWSGRQPNHLRWWDMFVADITMEILEDICHQVLDLYQSNKISGAESPPQLPASKAGPQALKRIPSASLVKKSPIVATTQSQPIVKSSNATANIQTVPSENSLDNQPIPKLITTNESIHYSYAAMYGVHGGQNMHQGIVPNSMYTNAVSPAMPPGMQTNMQANMQANVQQFQQGNSSAAYYQPPPPPSNRNFY